jgi:hypothetical protein
MRALGREIGHWDGKKGRNIYLLLQTVSLHLCNWAISYHPRRRKVSDSVEMTVQGKNPSQGPSDRVWEMQKLFPSNRLSACVESRTWSIYPIQLSR